MSPWSAGYITEVGYTHGFYRELTPSLLGFAALSRGTSAPCLTAQPFTYCELACGQGFGTNLLAAANPHGTFYATDFAPGQIANALSLARQANLPNVHFFDESFAEFAENPTIPKSFDIIALHGIYSWVTEENRRSIVRFLRERLKPGGLVYLSYNCMPGWAPMQPIQRLMRDWGAANPGKPLLERIGGALAFMERLKDGGAQYFNVNPALALRLDKLKTQNRTYVAHEYFNGEWRPFFFADVARDLAEAKLTYLGSANLLDQIDALNLTPAQQAILAEIGDPIFRESVRDTLVNQQFRRDIFARGALTLPLLSAREAWLNTRLALTTPGSLINRKVNGTLGEADLKPEIYDPLINRLDQGPTTVRELVAEPGVAQLGWAGLLQPLAILIGQNSCQPALPAQGERERKARTDVFNLAVLNRARESSDLTYLASPVTGGGVAVDRMGQMILLARRSKAPDAAQFIWGFLNAQRQNIVKEGKTLETPEENLAEIREKVKNFETNSIPSLVKLGIA